MHHCNMSARSMEVLCDSMWVAEIAKENLMLVWPCGSGEIHCSHWCFWLSGESKTCEVFLKSF